MYKWSGNKVRAIIFTDCNIIDFGGDYEDYMILKGEALVSVFPLLFNLGIDRKYDQNFP